MEAAAASTTPIDLRHTNQCRLYLKVERLSNLCNGAATELLPHALQQQYPRHNVQSNLTWPRQGEPSPRAWATWKRTLRRLFLADRFGLLTSLIPLDDRHVVRRHLMALLLRHHYKSGLRTHPT
jgi:hypothetical protein